MELADLRNVYFVGIGGIGMSAVARYFNALGIGIYGYDKTETKLTQALVTEGMDIHYTEDVHHIPTEIDLVVYTPAIPNDHAELQFFWANDFIVLKRSEVLGLISRSKKMIAIAGTHGKTTTTSILTYMLHQGGIDCTAFLGGIAQNFKSNYVAGKSDWVVVEADEYDRSFLHLEPNVAVILSTDADHLDIYGTHTSMLETGFKAFAKKTNAQGCLLLHEKVEKGMPFSYDTQKSFREKGIDIAQYGTQDAAFQATSVRVENGFFVFDYKSPIQNIDNIRFTLPGRHNVENATAAIVVAQRLGVSAKAIKQALATFKGIKRRFEIIGRKAQQVYIDDYAHHPSELNAAIGAARMLYPEKKLTGIFQPHLYSRTQDFADEFADALDGLDAVILMDIYPAREAPIKGVTSKLIFDKLKIKEKTQVCKDELMNVLEQTHFEMLMTLGAGDIDTFVPKIAKQFF